MSEKKCGLWSDEGTVNSHSRLCFLVERCCLLVAGVGQPCLLPAANAQPPPHPPAMRARAALLALAACATCAVAADPPRLPVVALRADVDVFGDSLLPFDSRSRQVRRGGSRSIATLAIASPCAPTWTSLATACCRSIPGVGR